MISGHKNIIALIVTIPFCLLVHAQKYSEYEVKAAFLEKFTRFVEWPEEVHIDDVNKPFVIAVLGKNPFNTILEKTYAKQKIKNKKVEIRYISALKEIAGCNLLFIAKSEYSRIEQIQSYIQELPILTVCDDERFFDKGVQIILFVESNHVYFRIDQEAVKFSGLYMNSLLLNLSKT